MNKELTNKRRKEIKKQVKELRKDPKLEVFSEERSFWETLVMSSETRTKQIETVLKVEEATLELYKIKLEEVKVAEQKLPKGN